MRLVTPGGKLKEINERDNPEEMQIIRSSYGLFGIVYEVTIRVRPTTALSVRHYSLSLENFRKYFPIYKARGFAVMYYIFPYVKRAVVELRKDNPEAQPTSRYTEEGVEPVARGMDLQRQLLDHQVVFIPGHVQILHRLPFQWENHSAARNILPLSIGFCIPSLACLRNVRFLTLHNTLSNRIADLHKWPR